MKRTATEDPEIWLYSSGIYYFRKGQLEISLRTKDFKEAVQRKRALLLKVDDFGVGALKLRMIDVADDYIKFREQEFKLGKIRQRTLEETKDILGRELIPYFGKERLHKITSPLWDKFRAGKTIDLTNHRKVCGGFLRWCKKQGYIKYLPDMDINPVKRKKLRRLHPGEMQAIWFNSEGSLRLFISMALFMGLRRGEIVKLEWSRVDFEKRAIFLGEDHTKTKESRWVTMPPVTADLLLGRKKAQEASGIKTKFVFPNEKSEKRHADINGLRTAWRTCLKRSGLADKKYRWHELRATCESMANIRKDLSAVQLEKYFGSSADIQRRLYSTLDINEIRAVENSELIQLVTTSVGRERGDDTKTSVESDATGGNHE